ncbi:MAG: hypothetical protein PHE10_06005 [Kiritimatiellae bacterium]|nr:hypothetical protein [Kiritimatiellia bacterium]
MIQIEKEPSISYVFRYPENAPELPDFKMPFGDALDPDNELVRLAGLITWPEIETLCSGLFAKKGRRAYFRARLSSRMSEINELIIRARPRRRAGAPVRGRTRLTAGAGRPRKPTLSGKTGLSSRL